MKNLTENQKSFLIEYFFKNDQFPGAKNIAITLLENGSCIVPGSECIWRGGIGNFIEVKPAENAFACLLYEFDLEYFLSSEYYKEIRDQYISILWDKKIKIDSEYEDICKLI